MHFELSIINGKTVFDIVCAHRSECIQIVREAYLAHADGQSVNPDSYFLQFPEKPDCRIRSEEHTSELQSLAYLVCRLLLEKKKKQHIYRLPHQTLHQY